MGKEPKKPATMEERWDEEDKQAPLGFDPNTGEPNVVPADMQDEAESDISDLDDDED